ncbi:MAG: two-component sensor histidine kinase [Rhodovulum sulfidophilum]|uniref:C4-dicarboxylate transport sensor protein DctB n=1 Tax=Rhodovulum sulfidophilum TaxID=35806 RepID=A0A2W5NCG8_RHOSU|nr:MAG: two-component sensor histidine kinase [Rhodovulum sulfidophilum]
MLDWRLILAGLALIGLAVWLGGRVAYRQQYAAAAARAETVLRLTVNALEADLARYEVVPQLIGDLDLLDALVADPGDRELRRRASAWLAEHGAAMDASDIYLILPTGETIAHSTYQGPGSFIGENFAYRPYFIDAMKGERARFFGVGTTSGVRGYYFSAPVRDALGRIGAVIAVKVDVDRIEAAWRGGEYRVIVTDPEGVVFLSSEPGWLYHGLLPLTPERRARTSASRRYANQPLTEFPAERRLSHGAETLRLPGPGEGTRDYIVASETMPDEGWTVHALLDSAGPRGEARFAALSLAPLLSAAGFGGLMWRQRRVQAAERRELRRLATAELERRVVARTSDLARVNGQLEQEIAERRATEAELRAAQESLVQVGKLAALGQMSAALSHEINQPLAAARNYADSAAILIDRGELGRARENIAQILGLVDRMAAIGKHLRQAARRPEAPLGAVALAPLLAETRTIVGPRLASAGAVLEIDVADDLPPLRAGPTRLQQVLVNLVTNAADAVAEGADRRITLSARVEQGRVAIRVRDRGPGVPPAIAARIFDPFFTTKGAGLGLGLSITANIVRDFGGEISCADARPGAA